MSVRALGLGGRCPLAGLLLTLASAGPSMVGAQDVWDDASSDETWGEPQDASEPSADGQGSDADLSWDDASDDAQEQGQDASEPSADEHALNAHLSAGFGATQRVVEHGSVEGRQQLDTAFVPAADLLLDVALTKGAWDVGLRLRYQTSLWSSATQAAPAGLGSSSPLRTHRFEAGLAPALRLSDAPDALSLHAFVGYGARALETVEELLIPRYTLHGPLLRAELALPIAGLLLLRAGPELHVITSVTRALRERGNLEGGGLSLGGQLSLAVSALDWLRVELSYRESHTGVASLWATDLSDVERYLMLDAQLTYY